MSISSNTRSTGDVLHSHSTQHVMHASEAGSPSTLRLVLSFFGSRTKHDEQTDEDEPHVPDQSDDNHDETKDSGDPGCLLGGGTSRFAHR
jgi:hypothetical protein